MPLWEPGKSANPAGRPKGSMSLVKRLAREHTAEAIETLVDIMRNGSKQTDRAHCAEVLLDRAWGRPGTEAPEPLTPEETARIMGAIGAELEKNPDALRTMIASVRDKAARQQETTASE